MKKQKIIKRNVSRHAYYIIHLAWRRNIPLINKSPWDLKDGIIKNGSDNLFGGVYPQLGWNNCKCLYYVDWKQSKLNRIKKYLPIPFVGKSSHWIKFSVIFHLKNHVIQN